MTRALTLIAVLLLIGLFALANWSAFTAPTTLSLVFTTVEAPLGLVMLAVTALLSVLFVLWALSLQAWALMETRRHAKEMQTQRELADKAEASRFIELRGFMLSELQQVGDSARHDHAELMTRLTQLQEESRVALEQSTNSLAAHIGELEDRVERGLPAHAPAPHGGSLLQR